MQVSVKQQLSKVYLPFELDWCFCDDGRLSKTSIFKILKTDRYSTPKRIHGQLSMRNNKIIIEDLREKDVKCNGQSITLPSVAFYQFMDLLKTSVGCYSLSMQSHSCSTIGFHAITQTQP